MRLLLMLLAHMSRTCNFFSICPLCIYDDKTPLEKQFAMVSLQLYKPVYNLYSLFFIAFTSPLAQKNTYAVIIAA